MESETPKNATYSETAEVVDTECEGVFEHKEINWVFCIEDWSSQGHGIETENRFYYSIFSFSAQLILPFIVISISYFMVYQRLKSQDAIRQRILGSEDRIQRENNRSARRTKLLVTISMVYLVS